jgi:hypothetical protein
VKLAFCAACGSTEDLQHHHLVTRGEGGGEDEANGRKRSLRDVAAELEAQGHLTAAGKRYAATAISRMLAS